MIYHRSNLNGDQTIERYRVIADWTATYDDPIALEEDEALWLTGRTDNWDGHVWVWSRNAAGKEGWIPDNIVTGADGKTRAKTAFDARELTCCRDEVLDRLDETHGWVLCRNADALVGWVPARNLERLPET